MIRTVFWAGRIIGIKEVENKGRSRWKIKKLEEQ
jgi:hypothetical protein